MEEKMSLIIPKEYKNLLETAEATERAIKKVKDTFQITFSAHLDLLRVTAPMVVVSGTGFNDDLSGVEKAVSFPIHDMPGTTAEVVHSLAKWKRWKLAELNIPAGKGLYTDMNAIRRDEETDNIHSIFVDQWDWEKIITKEERTLDTLKLTVKRIYRALLHTEYFISYEYSFIKRQLPEDIKFITAQELEDRYPELTPKEREYAAAKEYGAVFIMQIGGKLKSGNKHDGRAPDYDDWTLNGDLLMWSDPLDTAVELSSMGIRVNKESLENQLTLTGQEARKQFYYHKRLLEGSLPLTMGGGIGQSRLCMFMLRKAHVGEIQASIWPEEMRKICKENGINLL